MPERMTTRLKTLFQRPALFVLAGGINPIGAKMAEALGYDAFYMSGGNTSAHQLGWPNSGTSMRDMVDNARKIVLTVQIPVFADADTGYGDAFLRAREFASDMPRGLFHPLSRLATRRGASATMNAHSSERSSLLTRRWGEADSKSQSQ